MKVIVQRVNRAKCIVDGMIISEINKGYMLLVSFTHSDSFEQVDKMAKKISSLRIFEDEEGKMNKSIKDVNGEILSISQFTLYANPYDGNRPSFQECMFYKVAEPLYEYFNSKLEEYGIKVLPGKFGSYMELPIECDGPVTITLEFEAKNG